MVAPHYSTDEVDAVFDRLGNLMAGVPAGRRSVQKTVVNKAVERQGLLASQSMGVALTCLVNGEKYNMSPLFYRYFTVIAGVLP